MKPASPPRFLIFFSQTRGRRKNPTAFCPGKKQSKSCLLFPLSSIRVRLIRLLERCFPEQLQLRACNPGDTISQAAMRVFLHVDLKSLSIFAYLPSSHQQLQLTSSPSGQFHRSWQSSLCLQLQIPLVHLLFDVGCIKVSGTELLEVSSYV